MKFTLKRIKKEVVRNQSLQVYDLTVGNNHSYCVDGIIVHNSVCETRIVSAIGYPQFSSIIECSDAAHGLGGHICSDGGIVVPGDAARATGAGADFLMLGGYFSGTDECEGEWTLDENNQKKALKFYGMSSKEANDKYNGGLSNYKAAEGKCVEVPYKGPVEDVLQTIIGGLKSSCAYVGARRLKDFSKCCHFIRVSSESNEVYGKNR